MPSPTPFHPRTAALCTSLSYKEWAGCHAVCRYDVYHEREYYALRHAATVMDATPLYKYEVRGRSAADFLSHVMVRSFLTHKVGRVSYVCWCDNAGKVLDDGTVTRLSDEHFRVTSADPSLYWLERNARGFDVKIEDVSRSIAAVAVQGPKARTILRDLVGSSIDGLRFFRAMEVRVDGDAPFEAIITRTGYTGDLGYEVWVANDDALALWDALFEAGGPHGLLAMGLDALDVARVEAGFILQGVDYFSARSTLVERQTSSPYELNFDWMVKLDRDPFIGQEALRREKETGPPRRLIGLDVDWEEFQALYEALQLPPHLATETCRAGVPVYAGDRFVGQATSRTWSPSLKKYLALATVGAEYAEVGTDLAVEVTVEYERQQAAARVVRPPFFDPERKKG